MGNIEMKKVIYTGLLYLACDQSYAAAAGPTHPDGTFIDATEAGLLKSPVKPVPKPSGRRTGTSRVAPMPPLDGLGSGSLSTVATRTGSISMTTTLSTKRRARGFSYASAETASAAGPKAAWTAVDIKMANDKAVAKAMEGITASKAVWTAVDIKTANDEDVAKAMEGLVQEGSRSGAAKAQRRLFSGTPGGRTKAVSEDD